MLPDETPTSKSAKENNNQHGSGGGGRKTSSTTTSSTSKPIQEQLMKCPRCDSPNTKFCYYNNYSLTQPRHFCKTCRRYWTKGGSLRNVPIGGGCRKNKKLKSSSSSKDSVSSSSSEFVGGLKFLHSLSNPAMDFHHLGNGLPFLPRLQLQPQINHFSSFGGETMNMNYPASSNTVSASASAMNMNNYPFSSSNYNGAIQGMNSMNINHSNSNSNIASSIESLSSMNQDLHWKLQQQRLTMLFGGGGENQQKEKQTLQPILFQNLEVTKQGSSGDGNFCVGNSRRQGTNSGGGGGGGDIATEWFFENSCNGNVTPTATSSGGGGGGNGGGGGGDGGSNWNGGWSDVQQQYSTFP